MGPFLASLGLYPVETLQAVVYTLSLPRGREAGALLPVILQRGAYIASALPFSLCQNFTKGPGPRFYYWGTQATATGFLRNPGHSVAWFLGLVAAGLAGSCLSVHSVSPLGNSLWRWECHLSQQAFCAVVTVPSQTPLSSWQFCVRPHVFFTACQSRK